jgi:hypothetical protein
MLHQGDTLYQRRSNSFTIIVLQGLKIQEQGLDKKLQDLYWQIEVSLILPSLYTIKL